MSVEQNEALLRRMCDIVNSTRPYDYRPFVKIWDEFQTSDSLLHLNGKDIPLRRKEEIDKYLLDYAPEPNTIELTYTIEDIFGEEDKVAYRITTIIKQISTGEVQTLVEMGICRFVNGKIAEHWINSVPKQE